MSTNRRKLLLNTVSVNLGCSCRKPKLSDIFTPKPKSKPAAIKTTDHHHHHHHRDHHHHHRHHPKSTPVQGFGKIGGESVAVEKESDDPYLDFRHSMLQMILENEIYSKDDLRDLLNCFLQLNSPYHHGIIVRAFTEIWNGVFSLKHDSPATRGVGRKVT